MIYLGADHGGFELKEKLKKWLKEWGHDFDDLGNLELDPDDDYPDFALAVAKEVAQEDDSNKPWKERAKGILVCRSGGGVVIAANKVKGIRAVDVFDAKSARHSREHNDANVIALSGDWMNEETVREAVKVWLETEFSKDERHVRRIGKIIAYEEGKQ